MVDELDDPRRHEPAFVLSERDMLERWLEFHRVTLLLKTEGLDDEARKSRPVATSLLSLHGLVRHLAEVERNWFRRVLLEEPDAPPIWYDPAVETASSCLSMRPAGRMTLRHGRLSATPADWPLHRAVSKTLVCDAGSDARCGGSTST
jgi:hypothetical protein